MKNIQKALCLMLVLCLTLVAGAALAQDYTATEKGFGGDVTVTLTIENNEIVAAKAEGASETEGVGSKAIENLPAAMVEQNSVKVDAVASATITSNAVLAAAEKALAEARSEAGRPRQQRSDQGSSACRADVRKPGRHRCRRRLFRRERGDCCGERGREGLSD